MAIVKSYGPDSKITTKKDGKSLDKRDLMIVDDSGKGAAPSVGSHSMIVTDFWHGF